MPNFRKLFNCPPQKQKEIQPTAFLKSKRKIWQIPNGKRIRPRPPGCEARNLAKLIPGAGGPRSAKLGKNNFRRAPREQRRNEQFAN